MNKKLRRTFVVMATGAIAIVLVFLLILAGILNEQALKRTQNETIEQIYSYESQNINNDNLNSPNPPMDLMQQMKDRFIIVEIDSDNQTIIKNNFLDYLDDETIIQYSEDIINSASEYGVYKDFRYRLYDSDSQELLILLNISESQRLNAMLLEIFSLLTLLILVLSFVVLIFMSKYAIKPFVDNNNKQKRFITDASHELKTPVTSIITSTDVLLTEDKNNEWLNNIKNQSNHLTKLINDLVMLTRLDEQKIVEEAIDTNITDLTWEVLEPFNQRAKASNKTLNINIEDNLNFKIDNNYYTKSLSILLDNAIKYSNNNGNISLTVKKDKDKLNLEVYNTCNKLPIKNLNVLFDRFYRIDDSRNSKTGGSGIGLSIVKGLVDGHKDKIKVFTSNQEDITFKIIFK